MAPRIVWTIAMRFFRFFGRNRPIKSRIEWVFRNLTNGFIYSVTLFFRFPHSALASVLVVDNASNEYNDENYGNDGQAHGEIDFGAKLGIHTLRRFGWYMLFSTKRGRGVIPDLQKLKRGGGVGEALFV